MLMRLTLLSMALTVALPTYADTRLDLLDTLRLADQFDPNLAAVRATQAAAAQGTNISRAALLPRVVAGGSISDITLKQQRFDPGSTNPNDISNITTDYRSEQYTIRVTQPLFRWDAWHQHQAAKALRSQSEADAADQTQTLFLAVAEAYLNVLRAQDNLDLAQAQEVALER
ncbi:MAG: TolC family protein, partial [Moraxellaceae bacterium]|nr:TolC family protein [Moraxellaceae bacterium]